MDIILNLLGIAWNIIILLFVLGIIILIHELGHFYFAKRYGVYIYEFSIGMGPVIFSKKGKDNVNYNIRAVPIGGFVQMAGEVYEDDDTGEIPKKDFMCNKKWYQRLMIMIAGVVNNFILALVVLFFISLIWGGSLTKPVIKNVVEDTPAFTSGLEAGDRILKINGEKTSTWDNAQIVLAMKDKDGIYEFLVEKENKETKTIKIKPDDVIQNGVNTKVFGINIEVEETSGIIGSLKYAGVKFASIVDSMFLTLGALFTGKLSVNSLSGPVGMYQVVDIVKTSGLVNIIYLLAFLSVNVGILNILPFPAFDGGRVLFLLIEKIKGSPVNRNLENTLHMIGFVLLILLSLYVAFNDILKLI